MPNWIFENVSRLKYDCSKLRNFEEALIKRNLSPGWAGLIPS